MGEEGNVLDKLHCGDLLELIAVMLKGKNLIKSTMGEEAERYVDV